MIKNIAIATGILVIVTVLAILSSRNFTGSKSSAMDEDRSGLNGTRSSAEGRPRKAAARVPSGDGTTIGLPETEGPAKESKDDKPSRVKGPGEERWWTPVSPEKFFEIFQAKQASRDAFVAKYDRDGDGVLSNEERAAVFAKKPNLSEQEMLRYFDGDGDGVLSEIERAEGEAVMSAKNAESASWAEAANRRLERRLARFDTDGDGSLDLDESYAAYLSDIQSKSALRFRERFDSDADGTIGAPDFEAFMELYSSEDARADANDDGVINERDIEAFTIMMTNQTSDDAKP